MKTLGLWEAAKRGAETQLIELEIQRKQIEKLIAECDARLAGRRTPVQVHRTEKGKRRRIGLHWTQRPENRSKVQKLVRTMRARKKAA